MQSEGSSLFIFQLSSSGKDPGLLTSTLKFGQPGDTLNSLPASDLQACFSRYALPLHCALSQGHFLSV